MKNKKLIVLLSVAVAAFCVCAMVTTKAQLTTADASETQTQIVDDAFASIDYATWEVSNEERVKALVDDDDNGYYHASGHLDAEVAFSTTKKVQGLTKLQFNVNITNMGEWLAMYALDDVTKAFAEYNPGTVKVGDDAARIVCWGNNWADSSGIKNESLGWYTITFTKITEGDDAGKFTYTLAPKGGEVISTYTKTISILDDKYFVVTGNCMPAGIVLDNITIESDNVNATEMFQLGYTKATTSSTVTGLHYGDEESWYTFEVGTTGEFQEIVTMTNTDGHRGEVVSLSEGLGFAAAQAGDSLMCSTAVDKEETIASDVNVLNIKTSLVFGEGSNALALVMGAKSNDSILDGSLMLKMDGTNASVVYVAEETETTVIEPVAISDWTALSINLNKNGTVTLSCGDSAVGTGTCDVADYYAGNWGYYAYQTNEGTIKLKSVVASVGNFNVPYVKNTSHAFNNDFFGTETEDGVTEDEYIIYKAENMGNLYVDEEYEEFVFDSTHCDSTFTPNYTYEDFTVEFKVTACDMASTNNGWIGLSFGCRTTSSKYTAANLMILRLDPDQAADESGKNYVHMVHKPTTMVETLNKEIGDIFKGIQYNSDTGSRADVDANNAICVKVAVKDGTVSIYLKNVNDSKYVKYWEGTGFDGQTFGYVRVQAYETKVSFDDFSIANTSDFYVLADNITPAVAEEKIVEKEKLIYSQSSDDQNALDEVALNGLNTNGSSSTGCGSSISSVALITFGLIAIAICYFVSLKKKGEKNEN